MNKKGLLAAFLFLIMLSFTTALVIADETADTPTAPENVAVDAEGTPYPEGGPPDLYTSIEDKQQKLESDPDSKGIQNALAKLRRNLERALERLGIGSDDSPDTAEPPESPEMTDENEEISPETVAMDSEGNPYPEGGPPGLYNAIIDKQTKLASDPDNKGLQNSLEKLRRNMEKNLDKRGIERDSGDVETDTDTTVDQAAVEKPLKTEKIEKVGRPEKTEKPAKPEKPERPAKPEKPERPTKPEKPERPAKPEKPEKPERPERPNK